MTIVAGVMRGAGAAAAAAMLVASACDRTRRTPPREAHGMSQEDYDAWRRPDQLVAALGLRPGQTVADVGAGRGYLTRRLAASVGPGGHVVATDVDPTALDEVRRIARAPELAPIEARRVERDHPGLEPGRYDLVLLAQVDHLLADRAGYLRELRAALADGGRIAVSNRLQHRAGLVDAARRAGYRTVLDEGDLPGQFLAILTPDVEAPR